MGKPRVLILDDEPVILRNMAYILSEYGFQTLTAESEEKAKRLIENEPFDIVITDIRLLGVNGADVLSVLCREYPNIRYLVHTGDHNFELTEGMEACGIKREDILLKPIASIRELAERLHKEVK